MKIPYTTTTRLSVRLAAAGAVWFRLRAIIVGVAAIAIMAIATPGCQVRPSVEWRPTTTEPPHEKATLTSAEQRELRNALASVARDYEPSPDREPQPVMWEDIRRVVDAACSEVFMAVAQVTIVDEQTRHYRLRTIDEKPAELTITRIGDGLIDFRAEATVGLFEDEYERAAKLVEHFEQQLTRLRDRRYAAIGQ